MIADADFQALIKVFHIHVKSMVNKTTMFERRAIVTDWANLMETVDVALSGMIHEDNIEERRRMLKEFEKNLEEMNAPKYSAVISIPIVADKK